MQRSVSISSRWNSAQGSGIALAFSIACFQIAWAREIEVFSNTFTSYLFVWVDKLKLDDPPYILGQCSSTKLGLGKGGRYWRKRGMLEQQSQRNKRTKKSQNQCWKCSVDIRLRISVKKLRNTIRKGSSKHPVPFRNQNRNKNCYIPWFRSCGTGTPATSCRFVVLLSIYQEQTPGWVISWTLCFANSE